MATQLMHAVKRHQISTGAMLISYWRQTHVVMDGFHCFPTNDHSVMRAPLII